MKDAHLNLIAAVMVPVVGGLVTAAGVWGREWHSRRNSDDLRRRALDDAATRMTVVENWAKAVAELDGLSDQHSDHRMKAMNTLDEAYGLAAKALAAFPAPKKPLLSLRQLFLVGVTGSGARLVRAFYYCSLVWFVFVTVILTISTIKNMTAFDVIFALVMLFFFAITPTLALHAIATAMDGKARVKANSGQSSGSTAGNATNSPGVCMPYGVAAMPSHTQPPPAAPYWQDSGRWPPNGPDR
ncbi:hypothetical protein [Actinoplanes sp. M2I2]|uniref:hypothetical protein n=1 Tax=Actinoplanes sp. M2I2 TaxID=1734444 RepID=UPI00202222C9|nr:hypothetical protein [Actinoplanes sp. M2I2]